MAKSDTKVKSSPLSTCAGRTRAKKLKWKVRYEKNKTARALFYSEWQGSKGWNSPGIWHSTLNALSNGTH